jgi:hypothetical protein
MCGVHLSHAHISISDLVKLNSSATGRMQKNAERSLNDMKAFKAQTDLANVPMILSFFFPDPIFLISTPQQHPPPECLSRDWPGVP